MYHIWGPLPKLIRTLSERERDSTQTKNEI